MTPEPPPRHRAPLLLEPEAGAPARIEPDWQPRSLALPPRPRGSWGWLAGGTGLLLAVWAGFSSVAFVQDLFDRSALLGGLATAGLAAGLAMLGVAVLRESRAYRGLARVDRLRTTLAGSANLAAQRAAARDWVVGLGDAVPDPGAVLRAIEAAPAIAALHGVLRERVGAPLAGGAGRIGRQAALEGAALVAILPHPALDGVFAGLRGLRVIRQVAALYGLRPGTLMAVSLARRVVWTAAGTAGMDMLAQTMLDQVVTSVPGIRHVAASIPGAGVAAVRLYRLAGIAAAACDPVPPE